jgi:plastocyanin
MRMIAKKQRTTAAAIFVLALAASLGAACGETGDRDPTPVQTFKITPAANATQPPGAPTAEPTATTASQATPGGGGGTISIAGISNEFDVEEIEAFAGALTIEFDNQDGGVLHNIHFYRGEDADGESVAETELETGPITQTVTFDVQPGEYYYVCDAHPTTMEGILTVE